MVSCWYTDASSFQEREKLTELTGSGLGAHWKVWPGKHLGWSALSEQLSSESILSCSLRCVHTLGGWFTVVGNLGQRRWGWAWFCMDIVGNLWLISSCCQNLEELTGCGGREKSFLSQENATGHDGPIYFRVAFLLFEMRWGPMASQTSAERQALRERNGTVGIYF